MSDYIDRYLLFMRIFIVGVTVTASIVLLMFIVSSNSARNDSQVLGTSTQYAGQATETSETTGLIRTVSRLNETLVSVTNSVQDGANAAKNTIIGSGKSVASTSFSAIKAIGRGIASGITFSGRILGNTLLFIVHVPVNIVGVVINSSVLDSVIRPTGGYAEVPIIDPNSPELLAALQILPSEDSQNDDKSKGPVWPVNGRITTNFGVPHRPYQDIHSGIDISNGTLPGVTPVKPFRPGTVIDVVNSSYGLGNHVIVDHGNKITSVYAHLDSISVKVGQEVSLETTLGQQGTTGLSTGTHLHFEIRVNGQATDPTQFINGLP